MSLTVHLIIHVLLALLAGFIVWRLSGMFLPAIVAGFFGGVLIDLDHLYDYFLAYGWRFDIWAFLSGQYFSLNQKIYVLFHGWEYVILLALAALFFREKRLKTALFSLALGMFFHLVVDLSINRGMTFPGYSIMYRITHDFEIASVINSDE